MAVGRLNRMPTALRGNGGRGHERGRLVNCGTLVRAREGEARTDKGQGAAGARNKFFKYAVLFGIALYFRSLTMSRINAFAPLLPLLTMSN